MADWLDEIEAQVDETSPYYLPRLIAEIRRLRALADQGQRAADSRAQVNRLLAVRERVEAERNRLRHEAALFRQDRDDVRAFGKDCVANFAAWVSNQLSEALAAGETDPPPR